MPMGVVARKGGLGLHHAAESVMAPSLRSRVSR